MPNSIHSLLMMMSITTRPKTSPGLPSFTLLRCLIMSLESKHHIWPSSGPFIRVSITFYFQELFILIANLRIQIETFFHIYDLSIGSTETEYIKLNTKNQNIFVVYINENLTTFLYTLTGGQENRRRTKSFLF